MTKEEQASKKKIAIDDFSLLSTIGTVGQYVECELTHVFILDKEKSICRHYFAVCSYEEFKETDTELRDNKITEKLVQINENYSLGIIQKRLSLDEAKDIFDLLCSGSFCLRENSIIVPQNMQLLPKVHIPSYWSGSSVMLQKVLKPNFWGDTYIIEFFCPDNPFQDIFSAQEFVKLNLEISEVIKLDLASVNDRIGSFIFQFPVTNVFADCHVLPDYCNAKLSIDIQNESAIQPSDICTVVHTKLDDAITGFHVIYGIHEDYEFKLGDSNGFEYYVFNKNNMLIYKHLLCTFWKSTVITAKTGLQYAEPRTIPLEDGKFFEVRLFNYNQIRAGAAHDANDRIHRRMRFNDIIKQSGDFQVFNKGQRHEALQCIQEKIDIHSAFSSEVWLWDPFLCCRDIFDTLYYSDKIGLILKCISSYAKIRELAKLRGQNVTDFETFKAGQKLVFSRSNNLGINLEFRATHDQVGMKFHDRFIIFMPLDAADFPIVYTLGISVNGLGTSHHIIQRTLDPRKIVADFRIL